MVTSTGTKRHRLLRTSGVLALGSFVSLHSACWPDKHPQETDSSTESSQSGSTSTGTSSTTGPNGTSTTVSTGSSTTDGTDPWGGEDPSCGDGVPKAGTYCYSRMLLPPNVPVLGVADFDQDGHQDLLSRDKNSYLIYRGDGEGGFPQVMVHTVPEPWDVWMPGETIVDRMNDDVFPDIAVLRTRDDDSGTVTVFLNSGGEGFLPGKQSVISVNMLNVHRGAFYPGVSGEPRDFLGGNNTLAAQDAVLIPFKNDGSGLFQESEPSLSFESFGGCLMLDVAPLSASDSALPGLLIVRGPCSSGKTLSDVPLLIARPDMQGFVEYSDGPLAGVGASGVASADFDIDGNPDVLIWNSGAASTFETDTVPSASICFGFADGTFSAPVDLSVDELCDSCPPPSSGWYETTRIMTGDFDGDGRPDILNWSWLTMQVSSEPSGVWLEDRPHQIADFNEDGVDDIVTSFRDGQNHVLLSNP